MTWLVSLNTWVLVLIWMAIAGAFAALGRWFVRRRLPVSERPGILGLVAPLMPALGATFAVLTALTLSSEAGYLKSAQDLVSTEAAAASTLAWAATSPHVDRVAVQDALAGYLDATRRSEWSGDAAAAGDDDETAAALATLEATVRTEAARAEVGTPASNELLGSLDSLTRGRRERLAAASRSLPTLYVLTLVISGLALVANAGALQVNVSRRSALLVAGLVAVVAFSLALLFALTGPFRGPLTVSGHSIDEVVRQIQSGFFRLPG